MKRKKIRATKKNKEVIREYKKLNRGISILNITCSKCKRTFKIRTHRPELYTEEVIKSFVCLLCRNKGGDK